MIVVPCLDVESLMLIKKHAVYMCGTETTISVRDNPGQETNCIFSLRPIPLFHKTSLERVVMNINRLTITFLLEK